MRHCEKALKGRGSWLTKRVKIKRIKKIKTK